MSRTTKLAVVLIVLLSAMRILAATRLPEYNYDENRRASAVQSFLSTGDFEWDVFRIGMLPVFARTDAGFSSLPFLAPSIAWAAVFGSSPQSLRVLIMIITTLALILLAHAISLWYDKKSQDKVFLLSSIIALTLPWTFLQGFIFWDTSLAPVCLIVAFYAFTKIKLSETAKLWHQLLLPLALVTAVYLYLPSAVPAFVLYLAAIGYLYKSKLFSLKRVVVNFVAAGLAILPFVIFFFTFPDGNTRTGELSVFYQVSVWTGLANLFKSIALLVGPLFLFVVGDGSRAHSIGMMGMLGALAFIPLIWTIYYKKILSQKEKLLFWIAVLGVAAATLASALTDANSQPHSLRANAAAPFYIILLVLGTQKFLQKHPKATIPVYIVIALSVIAYLTAFFFLYLPVGREWFTN
ncbi:hypothetical protein FWG76_00805 [Candidatus Saccharibacteria bacterium]|nr:hypothetical protein [Candidatus Saccharibacteria bacterium]